MKFIDLFCGLGGFRLPLENRGYECVFSSDIDKHVRDSYLVNFGEMPKGDITQIKASEIPKHDLLCAGFPCQSFSISGKQGGISDSRGALFYEILRIAEYHKPSVLLLENVKNILTINNGNVIKTIVKELQKLDYKLSINLLNASNYGIPQARERVYFVAIKKGLSIDYTPPAETFKEVYLDDILEHSVDDNLFLQRNDIEITKDENGLAYALKPIRVGIVNLGGQGERIYSIKGHAITQSAYGGGVGAKTGLYNTLQGIRKLTVTECKRVMGFPDSHNVGNGVQGYKQLGNAVVPAMIENVYKSIGDIIQ